MALVTDIYNLEYTAKDLPQHILKQIQGIKHKALIAETTDNIRLAEWLLDYIEYSSKDLINKQTLLGNINNETGKMLGNYFKHIHEHCQEEIQAKMNKPVLTDDEAGEMFFENMAKDLLPDAKDFAINAAGNGVEVAVKFGTK